MLEVKVTVSMPELAGAINNLAAAISNKPVTQPVSAPQQIVQPVSAPQPIAQPVAPQPQPAPVNPIPLAAAPQFTVEQIMNAGAALMDAGKIEDLMNLLRSFRVQAVTELKPEQLGAFATEMRKLGAAI